MELRNLAQVVLMARTTQHGIDLKVVYSPFLNLIIHKAADHMVVVPEFYERGRFLKLLDEIVVPDPLHEELKAISSLKLPHKTQCANIIHFFSIHTKDA